MTELVEPDIIERCGGVIEDVRSEPDGGAYRRFWIDLALDDRGRPSMRH